MNSGKLRTLIDEIRRSVVPQARALRERDALIPTAFYYRSEDDQVVAQMLSDRPSFHDRAHKEIAAAMITAACRKVGAWALLVVVDADYWDLHEDAHERVGMTRDQFVKRINHDHEWLSEHRDALGVHHEAISFRLESLFGDWSATLVYQRHERYGFVWAPLQENDIDALTMSEGQFANLFPPPQTHARA